MTRMPGAIEPGTSAPVATHLAGGSHADDGAGAADRAMRMAGGDGEVGAVEPGGADPDQHLLRPWPGLRHILDLHPAGGDDGGFHGDLPGPRFRGSGP
ncbi:hypothetical protein [Dankookia sp. P2]|uniref:hypothetical protein n=1 Tax=Dankookia sp. P2 TaxID=3423955 RepID=UPI003D674E65